MTTVSKIFRYIFDSDYRFMIKSFKNTEKVVSVPDDEAVKRIYRAVFHQNLNLDDPKTYNEKLQWLKLYDRRPIYTTMVDKYAVKDYVASIIGRQYVIPTIGVWSSFDEIDFNSLPNQFVLKCTHDSGGLVIVKDKSLLDKKKAKSKIENSLKRRYYYSNREWPYKNVIPRIIAEPYLEDEITKDLRDYKFFTFDGVVRALFIATERQTEGEETKFDFFDENFNHLPMTNGHPNAKTTPSKPTQFELMKELASKLGDGIPQARIDFYECNGKVFFGEITLFHWSGFMPFVPKEWDYQFGEWIKLPVSKDV